MFSQNRRLSHRRYVDHTMKEPEVEESNSKALGHLLVGVTSDVLTEEKEIFLSYQTTNTLIEAQEVFPEKTMKYSHRRPRDFLIRGQNVLSEEIESSQVKKLLLSPHREFRHFSLKCWRSLCPHAIKITPAHWRKSSSFYAFPLGEQ